MTSVLGFAIDVDQNPYLPTGGRDVSVIVTVTADQTGDEPGPAGDSAEIIIIDRSISMGMPISKVVQACAATAAAVDVIRDGAWFAIIGGARNAQRVYPADGTMALADERTREEAKQAVRKLGLRGGTAMSAWLRLAYQMFQSCPATLRHAILLTGGPNIERRNRRLDAAIEQCAGAYRCDCRGVGTGWQVSELRKISTALLGTVDIVPDPAGLAADFEEMMRGAMSKQLPDVLFRVRVAYYAGQEEPADAIQEGLEASRRGDRETATAELGRAVALAHRAGNEDTARLLSKVVDVLDEATGTVRLKQKVETADEMALDIRSTKTVRVKLP